MINDISYSHQDCVGKEAGDTLAKKAKLKHLSITIKLSCFIYKFSRE